MGSEGTGSVRKTVELSAAEKQIYEELLKISIRLVKEVYGGTEPSMVAAVFDKVAPNLFWLRKEEPEWVEPEPEPEPEQEQEAENEAMDWREMLSKYGKEQTKAELLSKGWRQSRKNPDVLWLDWQGVRFFANLETGADWTKGVEQ